MKTFTITATTDDINDVEIVITCDIDISMSQAGRIIMALYPNAHNVFNIQITTLS